MRKLLVIGLDAAPPRLLYEELVGELPTLGALIEEGARYQLKSCHPPITIPAWAVMTTGKTPGELGLYGFRHRKPGAYNEYWIASSRSIHFPQTWDILGRRGLRSVIVGVPPSYPPRPIRGYMISCFITPSNEVRFTWPPSLKRELKDYIFDVVFRTNERDKLIQELWRMTKRRFQVLRMLSRRKWDFFMFVEIGVDRVQHAFWGYMDKEHHKYEPGNKYEEVIKEYYKLIDEELEQLLKEVPKDAIIVLVSDHGAKRMKGAFCVNQWLADEGYLKLKEEPKKPGMELREVEVDWSQTTAWGWGGYYARIFINLKGREPHGYIDKRDYEAIRDQLIRDLERIRGPHGERWDTKAYRPEDLYQEVKGSPPDLIVYFDDLSWRSAGTLGWPTNYLRENDRGPDDAVHDWYGIYVVHDPQGTIEVGEKGIMKIECINDHLLELIGV
ncbi:MAG: alkaline phosphatase family protein [Thermoprotei archaeon]|nr:alkaline phosphatase family protein [Thermoprotei archaeon]